MELLVSEAVTEKAWQILAACGLTVPTYLSMVPVEGPTVKLDSDTECLNITSLVNSAHYQSDHQTLQEFEFHEDMHVRLS